MGTILSLKSKVSESEAISQLRGCGVAQVLRRAATGMLRSVAQVYLPFRLYRVQLSNGGSRETRWFALDAVIGQLDLYEFESVPDTSQMVEIETRNRPAAVLDPARANGLLEDKLRRLIFEQGFFRVRELQIQAELEPLDLHVPYWVGFYDAGKRVHLRVIDAVRRRMEGAKARALFEDWLAG